jgi:hypothetical protein
MQEARLREVEHDLPFKQIGFVVLGGTGFGVVFPREAGEHLRLIRELQHESNYDKLQQQFETLERHGISVANHELHVVKENRLFLAVNFLSGTRLDHWAKAQKQDVSDPVVLKLASSLGRYFTEQFMTHGDCLWDIVTPFQYLVSNGTPVLVDLDTSASGSEGPKLSHEQLELNLGSFLVDIGTQYAVLLSEDASHTLNTELESMFQAATASSLFINGEPEAGLDTERYHYFI